MPNGNLFARIPDGRSDPLAKRSAPSDAPPDEPEPCDAHELCAHGEDPARCPFCHAP